MLILNHPELKQFIFFEEIFNKKNKAKLYICIVLVNIRNIYVIYSHSGLINLIFCLSFLQLMSFRCRSINEILI